MHSKVKWLRSTLAILLVLGLTVDVAQAASPIAGKLCKKIGQTTESQSKKFTCVKSGKKLAGIAYPTVPSERPAPSQPGTPTQNQGATTWNWDGQAQKWVSSGSVPDCKSPMIADGSFIDFASAIVKSQPGQSRGGSYKPHGTVRWSTACSHTKRMSRLRRHSTPP
jgi:hypothetical protein